MVKLSQMFDSHCHLQFAAYDKDRDEVIRRAEEAGVFMITVGTEAGRSAAAVDLARRHQGRIFAAVGLHPSHVGAEEHDAEETVYKVRPEKFEADFYRRLAADETVVAIGECGFDYYRLPAGLAGEEAKRFQKSTVLQQIKLASELDLPLIIHCREAFHDLLPLLHAEIHDGHLNRRGVFHSFTGTWRGAAACLDLGFYIGINGIVTFPPKKGIGKPPAVSMVEPLAEVVKKIPLDRLLLETDAPYLAPPPYRGKRNEPAHVRLVAEFVAKLLGISISKLEEQTTINAQTLFGRLKV